MVHFYEKYYALILGNLLLESYERFYLTGKIPCHDYNVVPTKWIIFDHDKNSGFKIPKVIFLEFKIIETIIPESTSPLPPSPAIKKFSKRFFYLFSAFLYLLEKDEKNHYKAIQIEKFLDLNGFLTIFSPYFLSCLLKNGSEKRKKYEKNH